MGNLDDMYDKTQLIFGLNFQKMPEKISNLLKENSSALSLLRLSLTKMIIILSATDAQNQISALMMASTQVLFCTLSTAGTPMVGQKFGAESGGGIDVLVIDEAAQAFEPEFLIPFSLHPRNLIMVR